MKTLKEALKDVKRLDQESADVGTDDISLDLSDDDTPSEEPTDGEVGNEESGDDMDLSLDDNDVNPSDIDGSDAPWSNMLGGAGGGGAAPEGGADPEAGTGEEPIAGQDGEELDAIADKSSEDPNRQGLIRTVKGAHLVYKRQGEDGTFEELWIYNISTLQDELTIRKAILSGTDIPTNKSSSPDGSQQYAMWCAGNAEMLLITGLQN